MKVRIRSDAGPDEGNARYIAGEARGAAAKFPNDPEVLTALAGAEYAAKRHADAIAAADRAIALDPSSLKALVTKGHALMDLAKKTPATADWHQIRTLFAKANHLDPDAAEPLMLYFQSFVEQGAAPPPMAVKGLMYALETAPFDNDLRRMVVRQLLVDGKLDEAKTAFVPIAYNPHFGKQREKNLKIMDRIVAGDAPGAIALLDEDRKEREKHKG